MNLWFLGVALSPFAALLFCFIARVIIRELNPFITNQGLRKILFVRW